ncbi:hypothetical protein Goshw_011081 [Gossypium schwendimanii]|uniref:Uncharacterized protein n=1 Tax=Gossypium schwendimanii TaxID=34291 RepID=A0A7J9MYS9_GOSSC|nr:hypothetical protein [Gossypium schwendimanii]
MILGCFYPLMELWPESLVMLQQEVWLVIGMEIGLWDLTDS